MSSPYVSSLSTTETKLDGLDLNSCDQQLPSVSLRPSEVLLDILQYNDSDFIPDNFFCQICKVPCSGCFPYRQHVKGKKHLKKLRLLNILSLSANSSVLQNKIPNTGKSVLSTGQYLADVVHQQKSKSSSDKGTEPMSSPETLVDEIPIAMQLDTVEEGKLDTIQKLQPTENIPSSMNYYCDSCQLFCNGLEQYNQHLLGNQHKKKSVHFLAAVNAASKNSNSSVCKSFLPNSPFSSQNLNAESSDIFSHRVTNEGAQTSSGVKRKYDTGNGYCSPFSCKVIGGFGTSISDYKNVSPTNFMCQVCNVTCNGWKPYNRHLKGKLHQKKAARRNVTSPDGAIGLPKCNPSDVGRLVLSSVRTKNDLVRHGVRVIEPDEDFTLDIFLDNFD